MATQISKSPLAIEQHPIDLPEVSGTISRWIRKVMNALSPKAPTNTQVNPAKIQHDLTKAQASMQLMNINR
ncbi:MAG: hypothetical protein IH840_04670 [Candidatus Heimdallarchaeota archaeon]|nr:hypothetical protein [Candidatus Heimdallarchaeota archaeon]